MDVILESLGDPIWQMGGVILLLVAVVLILALRSPEVHLAPWQQGLWTRITGLGKRTACASPCAVACPSQVVVAVFGCSNDKSAGSARRCCNQCCRHVGYRVQDPERCDLDDLAQASHLRNLHWRLLRRSVVLIVVCKITDHDVAAARGEKQQRGTRQRRAQPADRLVIVSRDQRRADARLDAPSFVRYVRLRCCTHPAWKIGGVASTATRE